MTGYEADALEALLAAGAILCGLSGLYQIIMNRRHRIFDWERDLPELRRSADEHHHVRIVP